MAKKQSEESDPLNELGLTERNKIFCREYIFDWNASRAYKIAYPDSSEDAARANAVRLITKDNIKQYIKDIQENLEELAGLSRLKVISEHKKIAYSSIAYMHNTWIQRKEFEELTDDQKACIAEIDTKVKTEFEFDPDNPTEKKPITVEYIKIKLYDKQKSLDAINKMLGYDAPIKTVLDLNLGNLPTINIRTKESKSD